MLDKVNEQIQETVKNSTNSVLSFASNKLALLQTSLTKYIDSKKQEQMAKVEIELNRPKWGDEQLLKKDDPTKVSNIGPKKQDLKANIKKGPLLK